MRHTSSNFSVASVCLSIILKLLKIMTQNVHFFGTQVHL